MQRRLDTNRLDDSTQSKTLLEALCIVEELDEGGWVNQEATQEEI